MLCYYRSLSANVKFVYNPLDFWLIQKYSLFLITRPDLMQLFKPLFNSWRLPLGVSLALPIGRGYK